ncbi:hypothetical protein MA16_Dca023780 [Dendrobium catenatum]|uniref:Uncharacterized protein n=1 Tax=Dendrobium catenatum TaxID=906689 RepID=A0A2I0X1D3_9ASPA|nr:hypothetical protein MA16_Dca023780 [Dendrobium catenatum]
MKIILKWIRGRNMLNFSAPTMDPLKGFFTLYYLKNHTVSALFTSPKIIKEREVKKRLQETS